MVPLARIAPALVQAVLIAEDDKFFQHGGFDWDAIEDAVERGLSNRRFDRGASTITQQLARNLYLSPKRSLVRKLREALITFRLERAMGKDRILELYLNVIEFGDQVFGVEAASRHYFRKPAVALAPEEAVRLASILTDPRRLSPSSQRLRWLNRKRRMIARRLHERRVIGEVAWQAMDGTFRP
jgi:monofunctional biosynthetic peptidoglycan transglycosylase